MTKDEVLNLLREGSVLIEFVKVGGPMRSMRATLNPMYIVYNKPIENNSGERKVSELTCSIWDIEANAWKSFRWENLRYVNGVNLPNGIK